MRKDASKALQKSAMRAFAVILLAGSAAGCSSDVSRFEGYLSKSDTITTSSIGRRGNSVDSNLPSPPGAVASNVYTPTASASNGNAGAIASQPWNQPMPAANGSTSVAASGSNIYDPISTGTVVKRQSLPSPGATAGSKQAMPQERPVKQAAAAVSIPDPVRTGTTPRKPAETPAPQKVAMSKPVDVPLPKKAPKQEQAVLPKAPEVETKQAAQAKTEPAMGGFYEVKPGDSLGRIAANHGTTIVALRAANKLSSDNIRIGQKLKVPGSSPAKVETTSVSTKTEKVDNTKTASTPKEYQPPVKQVSVEQAEKNTKVAVAAPQETGIGKYRWPARGAIIAGYGANVDGERNDGIDISLPEGSPVKSAENGVVIYSGDGLKKLGNTVLVRHADGKVTVYAHLKALNVQRGDKVRRGQVLASSGMTGNASRPKLHFEVRKDSAPVNPITFLE